MFYKLFLDFFLQRSFAHYWTSICSWSIILLQRGCNISYVHRASSFVNLLATHAAGRRLSFFNSKCPNFNWCQQLPIEMIAIQLIPSTVSASLPDFHFLSLDMNNAHEWPADRMSFQCNWGLKKQRADDLSGIRTAWYMESLTMIESKILWIKNDGEPHFVKEHELMSQHCIHTYRNKCDIPPWVGLSTISRLLEPSSSSAYTEA